MADNVTLNPGAAGDLIAADDINGVKFQRVKIAHGADGSATDTSATTPLPVVQAANVSLSLPPTSSSAKEKERVIEIGGV